MKRIALSLLMCLVTQAQADEQPKEWTIRSTDKLSAYVVLPTTAGTTSSGGEWYALVNYFEEGQYVTRYRVHVSGCANTSGLLLMTHANGNKSEVLNWSTGGDRLFDGLAFLVCRAAYTQRLLSFPSTKM